MTFRISNLLYLFALVAASLAIFGAGGLLLVWGILVFWVITLAKPSSGYASIAVAGLILGVIILLLMPAVEIGRSGARQAQCMNNLKQQALSIINFHQSLHRLPNTAVQLGDTDSMHSWRMRIVPFVESNHLYDSYHFDEAWNGPKNRQVVGTLPIPFYECPSHSHPTKSNYFAVTGAETVWGDGERRSFDDVSDELANTILLMEAAGRGIHWAEPKDLTFDEAVELLTTPLPTGDHDGHRVEHGYFYKPSYVRNVAMCDGSVHSLRVPIPREAAVALLTASSGENIDPEWLERQSSAELDYGRVWVFSLFVVLAILPGVPKVRPWVWPQITNSTTRAEASPLGPSSSSPD
ncbi:DUF1559 domain-containing protein [Aeoliella sp. ICT_H6.2]|uniref:DUF1559 domain-containing protein n=1 Tax=Aeoliella straminimaris TaxID=2954799 RepID=A0A9X2JI34_9BACT|nr:DUF1559 domain-containing protein [Aeoliella straminimaris]MCO6046107.1 DUF1559 domain-containing protein [Aeoliella straminimaris]